MNLSRLLSLGDGITFHRFRKNPFRPTKPDGSPFLLSVQPVSTQPVQPALDGLEQAGRSHAAGGARTPSRAAEGASSRPFTSIDSSRNTLNQHPEVAFPARSLGWTEKVEILVLKFLAIILALSCIGCGFGIQRIAYVRQKNELCRQLRQKEAELRTVTQAYRSLESCVVAKAADDLRRVETCAVIAKQAPRKVPTRG